MFTLIPRLIPRFRGIIFSNIQGQAGSKVIIKGIIKEILKGILMKAGRPISIRVCPNSSRLPVMLLTTGLLNCAPQGVSAGEVLPKPPEAIRRTVLERR
jgi:hypothetical protein